MCNILVLNIVYFFTDGKRSPEGPPYQQKKLRETELQYKQLAKVSVSTATIPQKMVVSFPIATFHEALVTTLEFFIHALGSLGGGNCSVCLLQLLLDTILLICSRVNNQPVTSRLTIHGNVQT